MQIFYGSIDAMGLLGINSTGNVWTFFPNWSRPDWLSNFGKISRHHHAGHFRSIISHYCQLTPDKKYLTAYKRRSPLENMRPSTGKKLGKNHQRALVLLISNYTHNAMCNTLTTFHVTEAFLRHAVMVLFIY